MEARKARNTGGLLISFFMFGMGVFGIINSLERGDNNTLLKSLFGTVIFLAFIIIGFLKRYKWTNN